MSYGFRVRFKLPPTALFSLTLEGERLDLESDVLGSAVWLKSMTPDVPLKDAEGVALRGEGFESEEIARSQGERWRDALQASLARLGMGADFGLRAPQGFATEQFLAELQAEQGSRVLNDEPGVMVFSTDPDPLFVSLSATGTKRPNEDRMREVFRVASATGPHHGEVETLAFDLYSASFFQASADARLLMLMMGLETLLTLQPRSHDARQHVAELMQATKEANLPSDEARSLLGSLSWLEKESISQAGRRLVSRLEPRTYMELTPVKFFNKCYSLRSALAHGHVPRPDLVDVGVIAASLELMMAHLLSGHLLDAVPD